MTKRDAARLQANYQQDVPALRVLLADAIQRLPAQQADAISARVLLHTGAYPEPSKGHVCWLVWDSAEPQEVYRSFRGELYRANRGNCIDCTTGYRHGRWETAAHTADGVLDRLIADCVGWGGQVVMPDGTVLGAAPLTEP
jgi:hypothetical protein